MNDSRRRARCDDHRLDHRVVAGGRAAGATAAAGSRHPARAFVRLPGAGRRRESTGPDRPAPRRAGRSGPALFAVDRPARDGPAAPSFRDVARGARAGAGGAGARRSRRALADLLVRAARLAALERGLRPEAREPGGLGPAIASCPAIPSWRRELLRLADLVLPNSRSEANQLIRLFGVATRADPRRSQRRAASIGTASPELFHDRWGADPFVLSVGRIEPRKNTLGLIQASAGSGCRWS